MSRNSYSAALTYKSFDRSWRDLFHNTKPLSRNTTGVDGVSINDFAINYKDNIGKLHRAVSEKRFSFSQLKPVLILKPSGKYRLICVPTVVDRLVQRTLLGFLADKYHAQLANSISFGFVKGRSVKQAAELACSYRKKQAWVFKTDITSFFDSVDREILSSAIRKRIRERSLHPLLSSALECEVVSSNRANVRRVAQLGIRRGIGVRQGMPLSPFFSNLLLQSFDQAVEKKGLRAVRYADDLIFFCNSRVECLSIAEFCKDEFGKIGLTIPAVDDENTKSVIYEPSQPAEFLGLELAPVQKAYELRLSEKQIQRLREEMLNYGSVKELLSRGITLATLGGKLSAKKNGYLAAYDACRNIEHVHNELNDIERKCLLKIYQKDLNIDIPSLKAEAHTFLGL